jgi:hypothetical protein
MSMPLPIRRLLIQTGCCLTLLGGWLAAGDAGAAAPATDTRLAGHWQFDAAASDNFETTLQRYLAARQKAMRPHDHRHRAMELTQVETAAGVPDDLPLEPQDSQRQRLEDALRPPQRLVIALQSAAVEFTADDLPPSSLPLDEKLIRIDASGSAEIRLRPASAGLAVDYRYLGNARRSQQFALDSKGDTLRVTLTWQDRDSTKLTVHSLYRRQGL